MPIASPTLFIAGIILLVLGVVGLVTSFGQTSVLTTVVGACVLYGSRT